MKRREMFQAKRIYRRSDEDISLKQRKYIRRKKDISEAKRIMYFQFEKISSLLKHYLLLLILVSSQVFLVAISTVSEFCN